MNLHPVLAIDTETTGPYLHHGCKAFAVSACDSEGNLWYWDFPVDPITREPQYDEATVNDIVRVIGRYNDYVFHNAVFDIRSLSMIDDRIKLLLEERQTHDTLLMSHIYDTEGSHGLKDIADRYLSIPGDDEKALKKACVKARATCRKYLPEWSIASSDCEHLPNHRGEFAYCDYWLPKAVATKLQYPEDHPWHTICEIYAERDVERTVLLYEKFLRYLDKHNLRHIYDDHVKVQAPVVAIQDNGIMFHRHKAVEAIHRLTDEIEPLQDKIAELTSKDFNYRSGKQLSEFLYDDMGLPVMASTQSGAPSTAASTLRDLIDSIDDGTEQYPKLHRGIEVVKAILGIRKRETTIRYINNYLNFAIRYSVEYSDGHREIQYYLHPSLNQTGTSTTRFSSSNPNGQNIGKGEDDEATGERLFNLRELFGPPTGYVWYAIDYKSLQLIIFAYESGDEGLINTFLEGGDPHHYVACGLFDTDSPTDLERRIAKNVNYAMIFGAGDRKIDATAGREGTAELYRNQFPGVNEYMQTVIRNARIEGFVKTAWGYPITTPADRAYKGVNYIVQGDEGEIVKRAMVNCHNFLKREHPDCELILQVHDELIFQCPQDYGFPLKEIAGLMMQPAADIGWRTPVDASLITSHWGQKKDLEI